MINAERYFGLQSGIRFISLNQIQTLKQLHFLDRKEEPQVGMESQLMLN